MHEAGQSWIENNGGIRLTYELKQKENIFMLDDTSILIRIQPTILYTITKNDNFIAVCSHFDTILTHF